MRDIETMEAFMSNEKSLCEFFRKILAVALFIFAFCPNGRAEDRPFQFALVGDTGYTAAGVEGFRHLLVAINRADLAFVVHIGDFENDGSRYNPATGAMPCTDQNYQLVYDSFQRAKSCKSRLDSFGFRRRQSRWQPWYCA